MLIYHGICTEDGIYFRAGFYTKPEKGKSPMRSPLATKISNLPAVVSQSIEEHRQNRVQYYRLKGYPFYASAFIEFTAAVLGDSDHVDDWEVAVVDSRDHFSRKRGRDIVLGRLRKRGHGV